MTLSGQLAGYNNGYAFLYSCSSDREVEVIGNCSCVDRGPLRLPNYMSVRKITDVKFASGQVSLSADSRFWTLSRPSLPRLFRTRTVKILGLYMMLINLKPERVIEQCHFKEQVICERFVESPAIKVNCKIFIRRHERAYWTK